MAKTATKRQAVPLTASALRSMIGCSVSYQGREGTIESVRPDMERRGLPSVGVRMSDTNALAVLKPFEIQ